jgi:hypothetical protein
MTVDELMSRAAQKCIDMREAHLVMFTEGINGYVCRNEGSIAESRALFKGTYHECQVWIERRGVEAALRYVMEHTIETPELAAASRTGVELLEVLVRLA